MKFGILTLDEAEVAGKTVLLRVDINQPVDKTTDTLQDITRVKAATKTIAELSQKGARVVILAHQGSDIEYKNFYTTRPHGKVLAKLLEKEVQFVEDVCGPTAQAAIQALRDGEILLLDNVRFEGEEQTLFEMHLKLSHEAQAQTRVVQRLAPLADLYVCDAFAAAHRDQPSLCGFQQILPSYMGRLFEEEFSVISALMENPQRPSVFVLGGAKIADAFLMMRKVLENGAADHVLTGGLVGQIMLLAKGIDIGERSTGFLKAKGFLGFVETAKEVLARYGDKVVIPSDMAYVRDGKRHEICVDKLPIEEDLLDIGEKTAKLFRLYIENAKTVFVNGPVGVFEQETTELGTKQVWLALGATKGYTVIGGGDSIAATNKYGQGNAIDYICTGGGALIRMLTGEELPVVKALRHSATKERKHENI